MIYKTLADTVRVWQLQVFNPETGQYEIHSADIDRDMLTEYARDHFSSWRVVDVNREKTLPLKPRAPYGRGKLNPRARWRWRAQPVEVSHE